jgi:cell division protein FtsB
MIIQVMDVFYIIMIAIIFGFIIHLETQSKIILEILRANNDYKSCREELEYLENQLDK